LSIGKSLFMVINCYFEIFDPSSLLLTSVNEILLAIFQFFQVLCVQFQVLMLFSGCFRGPLGRTSSFPAPQSINRARAYWYRYLLFPKLPLCVSILVSGAWLGQETNLLNMIGLTQTLPVHSLDCNF
jgi:hypothetical protein